MPQKSGGLSIIIRDKQRCEVSLVRCPTEFWVDPFVDPSSANPKSESDGSDGLPVAIPRHQNGVTNRHKIHVQRSALTTPAAALMGMVLGMEVEPRGTIIRNKQGEVDRDPTLTIFIAEQASW